MTNTEQTTNFHQVIRTLYPEKKFPPRYFPNLEKLLFKQIVLPHLKEQNLKLSDLTSGQIEEISENLLSFKRLLNNSPKIIVLLYERYIELFIRKKHFFTEEVIDLKQEVITRLIGDKIYKISKRYDPDFKDSPSFLSYFMVSVRNIYIDILRENKKRYEHSSSFSELEEVADGKISADIFKRTIMQEEFEKINMIYVMFYKIRPKLELCIKLNYRIPVLEEDVNTSLRGCNEIDLEVLKQDFRKVKNRVLFKIAADIFNRYEKTRNKPDSLRKWVFHKISEIITLLNSLHQKEVYNIKNFGDLISLYYEKGELPGDQMKKLLNGEENEI